MTIQSNGFGIVAKKDDILHDMTEEESAINYAEAKSPAATTVAARFAKEERWVKVSRMVVFSVMAISATLVGVETFQLSARQQHENFHQRRKFCGTFL